jgi:hypothetical protein
VVSLHHFDGALALRGEQKTNALLAHTTRTPGGGGLQRALDADVDKLDDV